MARTFPTKPPIVQQYEDALEEAKEFNATRQNWIGKAYYDAERVIMQPVSATNPRLRVKYGGLTVAQKHTFTQSIVNNIITDIKTELPGATNWDAGTEDRVLHGYLGHGSKFELMADTKKVVDQAGSDMNFGSFMQMLLSPQQDSQGNIVYDGLKAREASELRGAGRVFDPAAHAAPVANYVSQFLELDAGRPIHPDKLDGVEKIVALLSTYKKADANIEPFRMY